MDWDEQQDGAAEGTPDEAGAVLGTLRTVGLVGPKLALQMGDEECLARQVAVRAGLPYRGWILGLVKRQVQAAYESLELDVRLAGGEAPPGVQAVNDAVASMAKPAPSAGASSSREQGRTVIVLPKVGKMRKIVPGRMRTEKSAEDMEEEKVLMALVSELELVGAPVLQKVNMTADPERSRRALLGKYRPSTVRRYLAYWQGFRKWVMHGTGAPPVSSAQLVDYLHAREEEGMGASVPLSVGKSVAWFENLSGTEQSSWMSGDSFVEVVVKDLLKKLESGAPPRKRAPRMLSAFLPALEEVVMDSEIGCHLRAGAWVKLIKVWASLRFDDLAHLRSGMVKIYDGKFAGLMKRTKTTGAGKRVKELPFFVSEEAWVAHPDWVVVGLEALGRALGGDFELVVPAGVSRPGEAFNAVMAYPEAVAWSGEVMQLLKGQTGARLVPDGWERFWTEHSERSTMPSGLAALGVQKCDRDLLGRWTPEGSDQYVRTYNAVVKGLQKRFAVPIREGRGYEAYDEGAVLEEMKDWLVVKWGVNRDTANAAVEHWKPAVKGSGTFMDLLKEGNREETEAAKHSAQESTKESSSSSSSSSSEEVSQKRRKGVERLSEERGGGFVVVYNRIDRGKLHRSGREGCWMARQRKFKRADAYPELPEQSCYTSRCKLCWPDKEAALSSSDSEDELSESGLGDRPKDDVVYSPDQGAGDSFW